VSGIGAPISMTARIQWKKYAADAVLIVASIALPLLFMSRAPGVPVEEPRKISKPEAAPPESVRLVDMAVIEARNVFSLDGRYKEDPKKAAAAAAAPPPPRNYALVRLVGVLDKDGQRRAILREGAGEVVVLKTGDAFDDAAVWSMTDSSVVLKNYCEERTLRMFETSLKKH